MGDENVKRESWAVKYRRICSILRDGGLGERFYVTEPEKGARRVLWDMGGSVVKYCPDAAVTAAIMRYTDGRKGYCFEPRRAVDCMKHWLLTTEPIEEPPIIRMKSDRGLCFHRLPFDPDPVRIMNHPIFDEFLSRCTNATALADWIGSLFDLKSDRQQYVWLYGDGHNGKGTLLRFLAKCFGPSYLATSPSKDKFWTASLVGKRLVSFPDIADGYFPASPMFKMLTGDDQIPIRPMYKDGFSAPINCKFIFASNNLPELTSQKADTRRAIYCEIKPIKVSPDPKYEEMLWDEAPYIIGTCLSEYKERYRNHGPINVESDSLDAVIEQSELDFNAVFSRYFATPKTAICGENEREWSFGAEYLAIVLRETGVQKQAFINYFRAKHGIYNKSFRCGDKTIRRYVGAKQLLTITSFKTKYNAL